MRNVNLYHPQGFMHSYYSLALLLLGQFLGQPFIARAALKKSCSPSAPCHLEKAVQFLKQKPVLRLKYDSKSSNVIMGSESKTTGFLYVRNHQEFLITNQAAQETYYSPDAKRLFIKKGEQKFVLSDFRMSNTQEYMAFQIISGNSKVFQQNHIFGAGSPENICPDEKELIKFYIRNSSQPASDLDPIQAGASKNKLTLGEENSQGSYCVYVTRTVPVLIKKVFQKDDAENITELQFIYEEPPELQALLQMAYEHTEQKMPSPDAMLPTSSIVEELPVVKKVELVPVKPETQVVSKVIPPKKNKKLKVKKN